MKVRKRSATPEAEGPSEAHLLQLAELVFPYLSPRELASAALACKLLCRVASAVTARRTFDAAGGLESRTIPFINAVDSHPYTYFLYTRSPLLTLPSIGSDLFHSQPWGGGYAGGRGPMTTTAIDFDSYAAIAGGPGCECEGGCLDMGSKCPCTVLRPDFSGPGQPELELMTECGPSCRCETPRCDNRLTRRGVSVDLVIVKDSKKGWGLHANQLLQKGEFICEYSGEFLMTDEARRRQKIYDSLVRDGFSPALLVVREHLPSEKASFRVNIDATRVGNVARFINHSCDGGNLSSILVRSSGLVLPRLCFFAARDIGKGEELTFSYGGVGVTPKVNAHPCFCNSTGCLGTLPSEET